MQNLFICKFSALKIQFFPSVSVLPSSRAPLSFHPPRHPASFLVGTRSLALVELGLLCTQHGTGKAWLTSQTGCARHSVRGSPGSPNGMWRTRLLFGNVASPVQSSFLGIVPVGVYCQICILKKYCHADCGRRTFLRHVRTRRSQNPCWGARAPDGRRTLWGENAPDGRRTLIGARTQTAGAGHLEARTDGATLRRTTRQVLLNQR